MGKRERRRRASPGRHERVVQHEDGRPVSEQELKDEITGFLESAGLHPALVHATKVTGMMVTPMNLDSWDDEDLDEWEAAVVEGERLYGAIHP